LQYDAGSVLVWELTANTSSTSARGTSFDAVYVTGGNLLVSASSALDVVFNAAGSTVAWSDSFWSSDRAWTVIDFSSPSPATSSGVFSLGTVSPDSLGQTLQSVAGRESASFSVGTLGNAIVLTYSAVPEPSAIAMVAGAGVAVIALRSRRRLAESDNDRDEVNR
jgi:hypothetical protein